ncbi:MAG: DNA repair exonuclease [Ruminococcaceae bacterium]|nr:DNA repair exonuclease [Oscillospiraceae bacterium]
MKILHSGDLHLDTPFSALDERQAEIRKNELRAAFTSMMTYARMNEVDMAVFAGDVFEGCNVTRETIALVHKELEKFAKPVFIVAGNHDYADDKSLWYKHTFSENVHVFTEEQLSHIRVPSLGVTVWGYSFKAPMLHDNPARGRSASESGTPDDIHILLGHAEVNDPSQPYAPISDKDLTLFGADYVALGHVHMPTIYGDRIVYCGCLEPRRFSESGPHGACIVDIEKEHGISSVRIKRVRFAKRRYETASLDLTGCMVMDDVKERVADLIRQMKYGEDTLLRLRCSGVLADSLVLSPDYLENMGLFGLKLEDNTMPDPAQLAADNGIRGAFYRKLAPSLQDADPNVREVAKRALRYGLAAIAGENITD